MAELTQKGRSPQIGIVVRDMEVMTSFYGDGLGLTHLSDRPWPGGMHRYFACDGGMIKLVRVDNRPDVSNPPGGADGGSGLRFLTVLVDDIEAVSKRCLDAGGKEVYPIQTAAHGAVFSILEDPEGNWLEIAARPT